jgi:putative RecB family exonuclease
MGARVATNGRASRRNVARESPIPVLHSAPCRLTVTTAHRASGTAHYRGRVDAGTQLGLDALDPDFVPRPLVRVTPARLGTWADCPRRYRLTYLDRPPPPRAGARAASTLGAVVHLALRALYALPALERTPAAGAALVDRYWSNEGFRDAAQAAAYRLRAADWVADYAAGSGAGATPLAVERWVTVATPRIVVEGRVDRIDRRRGRDSRDELVIVDYKTGREPTSAHARRSSALALYALAARHTVRLPCSRVELHHLPTGEVVAADHDDESLRHHLARAEDAAEEVAAAAESLKSGDDPDVLFPARPAPRCGACDVRRHCPEGRAAVPESPPWSSLVA